MNDVVGQPAEVGFVMSITRAATGKTETYEMVGHVQQIQPKEDANGNNTHDSSTRRSD
jgi:hypothetical protein